MARKYEAIDLKKLYSQYCLLGPGTWNNRLTECVRTRDLNQLRQLLYSIQVGMDDLVKTKENTEQLIEFFVRLQRSIENTAKKIIRMLEPSPLDNPKNALNPGLNALQAKQRRDLRLEKFLRGGSF